MDRAPLSREPRIAPAGLITYLRPLRGYARRGCGGTFRKLACVGQTPELNSPLIAGAMKGTDGLVRELGDSSGAPGHAVAGLMHLTEGFSRATLATAASRKRLARLISSAP